MANILTLFLFGLLLIAPSYYAAPTASSEEVDMEATLKVFIERLKLVAIALEESLELSVEIMDKGPKLIDAVLKDPKVLEVKNEAMEENLKEMRTFLKEFNGLSEQKRKQGVLEIFGDLANIFQKYDDSKQESLSPEAIIIQKSLKDNGMTELENNLKKHMETFVKKFSTEVEHYFAGLNEKEKKAEEDFVEWFEKFKAENDTEKKLEMFGKFFGDDDE